MSVPPPGYPRGGGQVCPSPGYRPMLSPPHNSSMQQGVRYLLIFFLFLGQLCIVLSRPSPSGGAAGLGNLSRSPSSYHLVLIALILTLLFRLRTCVMLLLPMLTLVFPRLTPLSLYLCLLVQDLFDVSLAYDSCCCSSSIFLAQDKGSSHGFWGSSRFYPNGDHLQVLSRQSTSPSGSQTHSRQVVYS